RLPPLQSVHRPLQVSDLPGSEGPDGCEAAADCAHGESQRGRAERTPGGRHVLVEIHLLTGLLHGRVRSLRRAAPNASSPGQRVSGSMPGAMSNSSSTSRRLTEWPVAVIRLPSKRSARSSPEVRTTSAIAGWSKWLS